MPKNLHYIFDQRAPQSPAKPLQDLIVLKKMPLTVEDGFELLAGKLGEGCFSPISDELDSVDEVFFL